jgi:serine/threonine protein phosphatase 1
VTTRFQVSVLLMRTRCGRGRIRQHSAHYDVVENIDEIYLGHTIVKEHTQIDNCHYIDVGSSFTKKLCIVKIQ